MFSERLKQLRIEKGLSQQELADMLCVVRQTISKWEKGLSLPDAEMLVKLADALGVSVNELLGIQMENQTTQTEIIEQLMKINEQLVIKNRRSRKIWKAAAVVLSIFIFFNLVLAIFAVVLFMANKSTLSGTGSSEFVVESVSEEVLKDAPSMIIRDALSEDLHKNELAAEEYNWTYRAGTAGGSSSTSKDHPLLLGKDFLACIQLQEEIISGEYYLSFEDVEKPDEFTIYGWKISDMGDENAEPEVAIQETSDNMLELKKDMVYKIVAVWKNKLGRGYFGTATYLFYTE